MDGLYVYVHIFYKHPTQILVSTFTFNKYWTMNQIWEGCLWPYHYIKYLGT